MTKTIHPLTKSECIKWIEALRSGKYEQSNGVLKGWKGYCCLGVLNEIAGVGVPSDKGYLQDSPLYQIEFKDSFKLPMNVQRTLSLQNDGGRSFSEIADYIERSILPKCKD